MGDLTAKIWPHDGEVDELKQADGFKTNRHIIIIIHSLLVQGSLFAKKITHCSSCFKTYVIASSDSSIYHSHSFDSARAGQVLAA